MANWKPAAYWATTALFALVLMGGGVADLVRQPDFMALMARLGYPPYLCTLLGIWKVLGAAALLAPGLPRLKEWAYAGAVFDLTGAAFSHLMAGDGIAHAAWPLAFVGVAIASWALRPVGRRLAHQPGAYRPAVPGG